MHFTIDTKARTVTMPYDEFLKLTNDLLTAEQELARRAVPARPYVHTYHVRGHTQVWVVDTIGAYWVCSCPDFRHRRQSGPGELPLFNGSCKHIVQAREEDAQVNAARMRTRVLHRS